MLNFAVLSAEQAHAQLFQSILNYTNIFLSIADILTQFENFRTKASNLFFIFFNLNIKALTYFKSLATLSIKICSFSIAFLSFYPIWHIFKPDSLCLFNCPNRDNICLISSNLSYFIFYFSCFFWVRMLSPFSRCW